MKCSERFREMKRYCTGFSSGEKRGAWRSQDKKRAKMEEKSIFALSTRYSDRSEISILDRRTLVGLGAADGVIEKGVDLVTDGSDERA